MKKYEKPRIIIERFDLAEHIASCAFDKKGDVYVGDSEWGMSDLTIFSSGTCVLTKDQAMAQFQDFCVTNGGSGVELLFNS